MFMEMFAYTHIKAQHFSLNLFMSQRSLFICLTADLLPALTLLSCHFPFFWDGKDNDQWILRELRDRRGRRSSVCWAWSPGPTFSFSILCLCVSFLFSSLSFHLTRNDHRCGGTGHPFIWCPTWVRLSKVKVRSSMVIEDKLMRDSRVRLQSALR